MSDSSKSLDVVGVGACNADLFTYTTKMPVRGETVTGTSFAQGWGGKNHNQVGARVSVFFFFGFNFGWVLMSKVLQSAMLGSRTAVVSYVGDDAYGQ